MRADHVGNLPGDDRLAPVTPIWPGADEAWGAVQPAEADHSPRGAGSGSRTAPRSTSRSRSPQIFSTIEEASLRALGRRSLSRRELERALGGHEFPEHEISDELDRLEGVGLVDDFALAQRLIGQLQERKGLVGSAIKAELARRMIRPDAIAAAMELVDTGDELERACELAAVRARQYGRLDTATIERRLTAWLMRRGFSGSVVRMAVDAAVAALPTV